MSKPTRYACARCGPLAPDLVIRDHKRPTCALCGAEATRDVQVTAGSALGGARVLTINVSGNLFGPDTAEELRQRSSAFGNLRELMSPPPGIVSSRTWRPDGTVLNASWLTRLLSEEG